MNLRSNDLYWPTTCPQPNLDTPLRGKRTLKLDALIVGAGITGAFAAYELSRAGAKVAIVDRRDIAAGSTPASSALLLYELDTPLVELRKKLGRVHADAAYLASHRSLRQMGTLVRGLGMDVEFSLRQSLQVARTIRDIHALRSESLARGKLGIDARFLSRRQLCDDFGIDRAGAILNRDAAEVNPLALTYALLKQARTRGAVIQSHFDIDLSGLALAATPFRLKLNPQTDVVARTVVIATGYETLAEFKGLHEITEPRCTFALATHPLKRRPLPRRTLLWEFGDPYLYMRATSDNRVIVGGEDESFISPKRRDAQIGRKSRVLMKKLGTLFPELGATAEFAWGGTFTTTADGLPYIGTHRHWPHVFFALGYGGNGITFSLLAAKILAARHRGRQHPAAQLFRFDR